MYGTLQSTITKTYKNNQLISLGYPLYFALIEKLPIDKKYKCVCVSGAPCVCLCAERECMFMRVKLIENGTKKHQK